MEETLEKLYEKPTKRKVNKKNGLSLEPQSLGLNDWYYEEKRGITVVHEVIIETTYLRTDQIFIPWRKIEASLKRKMGS